MSNTHYKQNPIEKTKKKTLKRTLITLGLMLSRVTEGTEGFEEGEGAIGEEDKKRDCETEERGPLC